MRYLETQPGPHLVTSPEILGYIVKDGDWENDGDTGQQDAAQRFCIDPIALMVAGAKVDQRQVQMLDLLDITQILHDNPKELVLLLPRDELLLLLDEDAV